MIHEGILTEVNGDYKLLANILKVWVKIKKIYILTFFFIKEQFFYIKYP